MESELSMSSTDQNAAASMLPPATGSSKVNVGLTERIASVVAGAATASYALRNLKSLGGIALSLTSGFLLFRGLSGYCAFNNAIGRNTEKKKTSAMETTQIFNINKPRAEVYAYWRTLENLPSFMHHLEEVKVEDNVRSIWKAKVPGGIGTVSWESVITDDKPGELIAWSSLPGSTVDNAGEIKFQDDIKGLGTEIRVSMTYRLPAGDVGTLAGKLFSPMVESMIREDVKRFKSIMETGETAIPSSTNIEESKPLPETKPRKTRQSRKKPDPSIEHQADASNQFNESDLLERT